MPPPAAIVASAASRQSSFWGMATTAVAPTTNNRSSLLLSVCVCEMRRPLAGELSPCNDTRSQGPSTRSWTCPQSDRSTSPQFHSHKTACTRVRHMSVGDSVFIIRVRSQPAELRAAAGSKFSESEPGRQRHCSSPMGSLGPRRNLSRRYRTEGTRTPSSPSSWRRQRERERPRERQTERQADRKDRECALPGRAE